MSDVGVSILIIITNRGLRMHIKLVVRFLTLILR